MIFDSFYNSNPNLKLKILRELVTTFRGYVAGAEINNDIEIFGGSSIQNDIKTLMAENPEILKLIDNLKVKNKISDLERQIIEKFTSGTYGSYTLNDLLTEAAIYAGIPLNLYEKNKESSPLMSEALTVLFTGVERNFENFPDVRLKELIDGKNGEKNTKYVSMQDVCGYREVRKGEEKLTADFFNTLTKEVKEAIVEDHNAKEKGVYEYKKSKEVKDPEDITPDIDVFYLPNDDKQEYKLEGQKWYQRKQGSDQWSDVTNRRKKNKLNSEYAKQQNDTTDNSSTSELSIDAPKQYTVSTFTAFLRSNPQRMPSYLGTKPISIIKPAINGNTSTYTPNDPNMGAVIIRKPMLGRGSRNDNYLSIFFSAISQLELSRCTPYLSLTFYTKGEKGQQFNEASSIGYMRFDNGKGLFKNAAFTADDALDALTQNNISRFLDENKSELINSVNYMDIFTSPQTMVNANMNSNKGFSMDNLINPTNNNDSFIEDLNNALDPFAPMLTLKNFNATISGGGDFLVTNREAKVSMVLHDRSRLNEIAPFVSLSQLGRTLVKVEHGWSHPEGDIVKSNNEIGKFINNLRETQIYTLNMADFSFSGNEVSINLQLSFWGGTDFKNTHVAMGSHQDATDLQNKIVEVVNDMAARNILKSQTHDGEFALQQIPSPASLDPSEDQKYYDEGNKRILKHVEIIRNSAEAVKVLLKTEAVKKINQKIDALTVYKQDKTKEIDTYYHLEIIILYFLALADAGDDLIKISSDTRELMNQKDPASLIELMNDEKFFNSVKELEEKARRNLADLLVQKLESVTAMKIERNKEGITKTLLTPDPFQNKLAYTYVTPPPNPEEPTTEETQALNDYHDLFNYPNGHISLGKLISSFVALPLSAKQNYDEIQLFFYPINNNAAGARKYTTASLPVNIQELKTEIYKLIEIGGDMTIIGFFDILSNYFQNNNLEIYELSDSSFGSKVEDREKKIRGEKNFHENAYNKYYSLKQKMPESDKQKKAAEKIYVKERLANQSASSLKEDLEKIYSKDRLGMGSLTSFKKPVIHLELETMPRIVPKKAAMDPTSDTSMPDKEKALLEATGIDNNTKILKIHVYDENATSRPAETMFMEGLVEPESFFPIAGILNDSDFKGNTNGLSKFEKSASSYVMNMSAREIKEYVSRAFPTIRYGSQQSVVKQINVSSNTSNEIVNARMMESMHKQAQKGEAVSTGNIPRAKPMEEFIIPTSIDMTIYGCPFITMGLNVFVDMQTGTDIDNVYMVGNVTHTISAGEYTTNVSLYLPQIGTTRDMRSRLLASLEKHTTAEIREEALARAQEAELVEELLSGDY